MLRHFRKCVLLRVSKKNIFFNFVASVEPLVRTSSQSPQKKFQRYRPINDTWPTIWNFETHDPTVYPTILGGDSRGFWNVFLDLGAQSAIFWHLKSVVYGSITLKFFLGALGTSPHQWFNRGNRIQKKCFFGTPYRSSFSWLHFSH